MKYIIFIRKETILVELAPQNAMPYKPGDHVAVFPTNKVEDVELILEHTILPAEVMPCDPIKMDMQVSLDNGKSIVLGSPGSTSVYFLQIFRNHSFIAVRV